MRATVFKVIMFFIPFLYIQGIVLPWAMSNNVLPLWADIIILTFILLIWMLVLERFADKFIKDDEDDNDKSGT